MKTRNPKISFNTAPDPQVGTSPEARNEEEMAEVRYQGHADQNHEGPQYLEENATHNMHDGMSTEPFQPAPAPRPETVATAVDAFDRAEWEKQLNEPKTEPEPELAPDPGPEPQRVADAPAPFPLPPKKTQNARLAALGKMARPEPSFLERNSGMLGVVGVVAVTFAAGLGTALWFLGDDNEAQATFSQPVAAAAFAEMTPEPDPSDETVTRTLAPDMSDVSETAPQATTTSPPDLTSAVLTALQNRTATPQPPETSAARLNREALEILSNNKMRMLREGVLADVYDVETYRRDGVTRVRLRTINVPLVGEYASETLLKAMAAGQIEMSKSLITPEGSVDVETMMFNLVQVSLRSDHSTSGMNAAHGMSRKIFAASPARTQNIDGERVYTVQAGDSLAYIALQFYGSPNAYARILEANRNTLQSPEQIQVGQRLVIPS